VIDMGNGIPRLLRWLAVLGMWLALFNFVFSVAHWAAPFRGEWVGKRFKDVVSPPTAGTVRPAFGPNPPAPVSSGRLVNYLRAEMMGLFQEVREPSIWFCATSIVYLLATRQLAAGRSLAYAPEEIDE
jgi:hypothetical protein